MTTDTGAPVTVRMSLSGAGPEIFSTSPRKRLMVKLPEDKIPGHDLERKDEEDPGKDAGSERGAG